MSDIDIELVCLRLSRRCIKDAVPQEASIFDAVWGVVRDRIFPEGKVTSPDTWGISTSSPGLAKGLAFHGGSEGLLAPCIIAVLSATVLSVVGLEDCSSQTIAALTSKYVAQFNAPQWVGSHIQALVEELKGKPGASATVRPTGASYLVWKNGKGPEPISQKDVTRSRNEALSGKLDVFANDAGPGELLVRGKESSMHLGETNTWRTLLALLERVGSRWTREELFKKVQPLVAFDRKVQQQAYQQVRHVKQVLMDDFEHHHLGNCTIVDEWFDTTSPNRISIAADLRACLIRPSGT